MTDQENTLLKKLRESEELFHAMFDSANVGKSATLPGGEIRVNKAFCDMLSYTPEELKNKKWQELTPPEDIPAVDAVLKPLLEGSVDATRFEKRYLRKDGSILWGDVSTRLRRDEEGRPLYFITTVVDITDRKRAEEFLQAERDRAQSYLDIVDTIIIHVASDRTITLINRKGCSLLGYPHEELIGKDWVETAIPPEQREQIREVFGRIVAGEIAQLEFYENDIITKNGARRTVAWHNVLDRDRSGNILGTLSSGEDITEQKQTEEQLRKSEERYRLIAENTADAITVHDLSLRPIYLSPSNEKLKGFTIEEMLAQTTEQTMTPESLQRVYRAFEEEMALEKSGAADPARKRIMMLEEYRKDGSTVWVENTLSFIRDEQGIPKTILSVSRDITERRRAEEALRESERSLRSTIDGLSSHIALLDEHGTILLTNKTWRDFAENNGLSAGKVSEGTNYLRICDNATGPYAEEAAPFAQGIRDVLAGKSETFSMEYPCNSPDKVRWFVGRVTLFPGDGPRRAVIAHENYTKRKLLELEREELIKALQDKNDEMESMLYAASHDLRTPLVSIMGFNGIVRQSLAEIQSILGNDLPMGDMCAAAKPLIAEKIPLAVEYIGKSAEKMQGLINGILQLSRLGRTTHVPEKIDMNALVRRALSTLDFQKLQAHAAVSVGELPSCWGDPHELEQAFINLIDNAVKYRDPARPLTIDISGSQTEQGSRYDIADNGIGMKPEHLGQIWGLFARLDPNGPVPGEGLGLALVQRIVQRHHGKVWVESERGKGSVFHLSLPKDRAVAEVSC